MTLCRPLLTVAALTAAITVAGCSSNTPSAPDGPTVDDLRGHTVTALDFPKQVFDGWEITDPLERPVDGIPAITRALASAADPVYSPEACSPTGEQGAALWSAARGAESWAGQVGENVTSGQSFTTAVAELDPAGLNAVTSFAEKCATYTVAADGTTATAVTEVTNAEPLRYGLSDARLFTTTVTVDGRPESTYSTLTGVGQVDGRVVAGQFTTGGTVEGAVINVAGNWWNIVARKAVNGQQ